MSTRQASIRALRAPAKSRGRPWWAAEAWLWVSTSIGIAATVAAHAAASR